MKISSTLQRFHSQTIVKRYFKTNIKHSIKNENLSVKYPHGCNDSGNLISMMQWRVSEAKHGPRLQYQTSVKVSRGFSTITRGFDLLAGSLRSGSRRKIILDAFAPTGFDVLNLLHYPNRSDDDDDVEEQNLERQQLTHMNGSIIAFPNSCFLWNVSDPKDVTIESLSLVLLHSPEIEFLFIGSETPVPPKELNKLKKALTKRNIVVEQLDVTHAMGTFNILNGEDRRVAAALLLPVE